MDNTNLAEPNGLPSANATFALLPVFFYFTSVVDANALDAFFRGVYEASQIPINQGRLQATLFWLAAWAVVYVARVGWNAGSDDDVSIFLGSDPYEPEAPTRAGARSPVRRVATSPARPPRSAMRSVSPNPPRPSASLAPPVSVVPPPPSESLRVPPSDTLPPPLVVSDSDDSPPTKRKRAVESKVTKKPRVEKTTTTTKSSRAKSTKEVPEAPVLPAKPKNPLGPMLYYSRDTGIRADLSNSFKKNLNRDQKRMYFQMAEVDKQRYRAEMEAYKAYLDSLKTPSPPRDSPAK